MAASAGASRSGLLTKTKDYHCSTPERKDFYEDDAPHIAKWERKIRRLTNGERFSKKSLSAFQGSSPAGRRQWRGCLFGEIRQAAAKGQAVNALC